METSTGDPTPRPRVRLDVLGPALDLFKAQAGVWLVAALIVVAIQCVVGFVAGVVIPIVGSVVAFATGGVLSVGLYRMALKQLGGAPPAIEDLFKVEDVIVHAAVAGLLGTLAVAVGGVFCIVPGLIAAGLFLFAPLLVAEQRLDGVDALKLSWNTLSGQLVDAGVFVLVVVLLNVLGALCCGVGLLVTVPLSILATTLVYREFFPQDQATPVLPPAAGA